MYFNAFLRQKFNLNPQWRNASMPEKFIKALAGRGLRKLGALSSMKETDLVSFKVDRSAPNYILDIEPYARNF